MRQRACEAPLAGPRLTPSRPLLEAFGVAGLEALGGAEHGAPAGALVAARVAACGGVEPEAGDDHERVTGVRVDGDPLTFAGLFPLHEAGGVERGAEQLAAAERVGDGAGAVVAGVAEAGVADMYASAWYGIVAPAGTPPDVVARLNREINAVAADPDMRRRMEAMGAQVPDAQTPEAVKNAIEQFETDGGAIEPLACRANASRFSEDNFDEAIREAAASVRALHVT